MPNNRMRQDDVLTTGAAARLCKVAPRTVSQWCDRGWLQHWRLPGGMDRRILRADLVRFLRQHGMPAEAVEHAGAGRCRVLLVGLDGALAAAVAALLPAADFELQAAAGGFDAGLLAAERPPDAVVIDLAGTLAGRGEGLSLARQARMSHPDALLLAVAGEDETDAEGLAVAGFGGVYRRPFDPEVLACGLQAAGRTAEDGGRLVRAAKERRA